MKAEFVQAMVQTWFFYGLKAMESCKKAGAEGLGDHAPLSRQLPKGWDVPPDTHSPSYGS